MVAIRLERVDKMFPGGAPAVRSLDLDVGDGELLVLVGPSGCGKSTVLRLIAGLETVSAGRVLLGGRDVTGVPPQERDLAMVFQNYALYPHLTVRDNLAFGLRMRRQGAAVIAERVTRVAGSLGLQPLLDRKPAQLSGGQRQRVALGRALVREPQAFLLDEPLSNLDASLRVQTRAELSRIHRQLRATMVYVTHDQEEAMTLGDRIAVLRDGALQQVGTPLSVYHRPANAFVAGFVGAPAMNLLPCSVHRDGGATQVVAAAFALTLARPPGGTGAAALLGVRPADVELASENGADARARVDVVQPLGSQQLVHLVLGDGTTGVTALWAADPPLAADAVVGLRLRRDRLHLFDAASGTRMPVPEG